MFDTVDDVATRLDLQHAMRQLTPGQAVAVRLWLAGHTHAEIGDAWGVSRRAISYRIERAKVRLGELLV